MENLLIKKTKLIAIYGRVSTSNQESEGTIETQLLAVSEFAKLHGYTIVKEYLDEGWSGDNLIRPGLDQLRMDAKKRNWEAVLIYDPDRLARRGAWQEVVMEELKELEIDVLFVTIPQPKTDEEIIMYKMRGVFTEYERMKIKERFRLGKVRKVREGNLLVSEPLYGYTYIKKEDKIHGYYKVNQEESKVIQMIFKWIDEEGLTQRKIVTRLYQLGIKPRKSKRGVWSTSTLTTLLKHKAYIGEAHWGSSYAVVPENPKSTTKYRKVKKSSRRMKPEEEWYKIPVPPIIDKELFYRVRERVERNFKQSIRNKKYDYLLIGLIFCSCGRRRSGEGPKHGKYLYYRCNDRINNFPLPKTCLQGGINARIIDNMVWQSISMLMTSPQIILEHATRWKNIKSTKNTFQPDEIRQIEDELMNSKMEEIRFNRAYGAGMLTLEQLREFLIPIKEKITMLESQIERAREQERNSEEIKIPDMDQIEVFVKNVKEKLMDLSFEVKRGIMMNVIEKIVGTQQELQICGYIPITTENNVSFFSGDRNGMSTNRPSNIREIGNNIPFKLTIQIPTPQKLFGNK
ncbi:MAG: recombinase family protein [Bacteroidota bacterium]|nr:recombinase family protein [Bacteroidota bacterium]